MFCTVMLVFLHHLYGTLEHLDILELLLQEWIIQPDAGHNFECHSSSVIEGPLKLNNCFSQPFLGELVCLFVTDGSNQRILLLDT